MSQEWPVSYCNTCKYGICLNIINLNFDYTVYTAQWESYTLCIVRKTGNGYSDVLTFANINKDIVDKANKKKVFTILTSLKVNICSEHLYSSTQPGPS